MSPFDSPWSTGIQHHHSLQATPEARTPFFVTFHPARPVVTYVSKKRSRQEFLPTSFPNSRGNRRENREGGLFNGCFGGSQQTWGEIWDIKFSMWSCGPNDGSTEFSGVRISVVFFWWMFFLFLHHWKSLFVVKINLERFLYPKNATPARHIHLPCSPILVQMNQIGYRFSGGVWFLRLDIVKVLLLMVQTSQGQPPGM